MTWQSVLSLHAEKYEDRDTDNDLDDTQSNTALR
jgi:hypothetical protein